MSTPSPAAVHEIFQAHLREVDFWQSVAETVAEQLQQALRHLRIPGKVEARAKTTGSVVGKAYRRPDAYEALSAFRDLAGARVLVPFTSDVEPVANELKGNPDLRVIKDEVKVRKADELTYQARHLDIELGPAFELTPPVDFGGRRVLCEVQIQTFAQSLWASVSHLVVYKRELPDDIRARVNRLVALCEIFDDEAVQSRSLALQTVDTLGVIAAELQRYFFGITGVQHDPEQAVVLVGRLLPAISDEELPTYLSLLETFVQEHGIRLTQLLTDRPEARGIFWLLRPESILVFERLTRRPAALRQVWACEFPPGDLDALEAVWGPVDLA